MEITLRRERKIGAGHPAYIIAEVGSNWTSLEDCLESILQAKIAGADAVKFQLFTVEELFGIHPNEAQHLFPHLKVGDNCNPYALNPEWLPKLKAESDKRGIDFMCTAFSPEGYDIVNPYVDIHKVASSECCHLRILQKLRQLGKPVILSTGAKGVDDIRGAVEILTEVNSWDQHPPVPTILLYCAVAYPASEVKLETINLMREQFGTLVGFSDHSTDVYTIPRTAVTSLSATVLEKHFTAISARTPDSPHSLTVDQFKSMVGAIRDGVVPSIGPTHEEKTALLRYNRRLIITKDVAHGDQLQEGVNFGIYRSLVDDTRAAHPFMVDNFIGKRAKIPLKAGQGLWVEDVE